MTNAAPKTRMIFYKVSWRGPEIWPENSANRGKPKYHEKQFRGSDLKSAQAFAKAVQKRIKDGEFISDLELRGCTDIWGKEMGFPMAMMSDKINF